MISDAELRWVTVGIEFDVDWSDFSRGATHQIWLEQPSRYWQGAPPSNFDTRPSIRRFFRFDTLDSGALLIGRANVNNK